MPAPKWTPETKRYVFAASILLLLTSLLVQQITKIDIDLRFSAISGIIIKVDTPAEQVRGSQLTLAVIVSSAQTEGEETA